MTEWHEAEVDFQVGDVECRAFYAYAKGLEGIRTPPDRAEPDDPPEVELRGLCVLTDAPLLPYLDDCELVRIAKAKIEADMNERLAERPEDEGD